MTYQPLPFTTMQTPDLSAELHAALLEIYNVRAYGRYGLSKVNQLLHAVQSGSLAKSQQLPRTLVVAALLHDIGHMVHDLGEHPAAQGIDDCHENVGAAWLKRYFGPAVVEPVRLHVAAKRYLCTVERGYHAKLSADSIESLALQGGPMSAEEASAFEKETFWKEAVALRRIDEVAKDPHGPMPLFATFLGDIEAVRRAHPAS
jgi:predicted HD phosphohydrolase